MKSRLLLGSTFGVICGLAGPALVAITASAADVAADQTVSRFPLDLARSSIGTQVQVREPNGTVQLANRPAEALIGEDATQAYALAAGKTTFILSLAQIQVLSHFNFIDNGAEGRMSVAVSGTKLGFDADGWRSVSAEENFDGRRVVSCEFGNIEGRYVKVDFDTKTAGHIAGFGLFGAPAISSYRQAALANLNYVTTPTKSDVAGASQDRGAFYDYASLSMGAKVVAVSHADSLADAQYMIDGNMATSFTFDPADPNPIAVIDLGTRRTIDRVSAVFEAPAGHLDFYLVENAYTKDDSQAVGLNYITPPGVAPVTNAETLNYSGQTALAHRQPVGSVDVNGDAGVNRVSVNVTGMTGRFLIAAFHRSGGRKSSGDPKDHDFKDFKDKDAVADNPVKVEGISAFGESPTAQSIPLLPPTAARATLVGPRPPVNPPSGTRPVSP